jgi:hypothetical protein
MGCTPHDIRMKNPYRLISRGSRKGAFYCLDGSTGQRTRLGACSKDEAGQIVLARNQAPIKIIPHHRLKKGPNTDPLFLPR